MPQFNIIFPIWVLFFSPPQPYDKLGRIMRDSSHFLQMTLTRFRKIGAALNHLRGDDPEMVREALAPGRQHGG